jgi:hypothetical protein
LSLSSIILLGQSKDSWTSFWNKDTTLIGYKNKDGTVKIEPKFVGVTIAKEFDDIIAVTEAINDSSASYYLTKTGRIVGRDSLYIFDNGADCESEGYIRFHDGKTDKVGMFNKNGDIVVPAEYNALSNIRNGMIIALKGAEKKQRGEHFSWKGGEVLLIDSINRTLITNFKFYYNLNFFSVIISDHPTKDSIRQTFQGVNGQYYSFIDFDKEFWQWLKTSLLRDLTKKALLSSSFQKITVWKEPEGWIGEEKGYFIEKNFELLNTKLLELNSSKCDYSIFAEGLNPFIFESEEYKEYFNNCAASKDWLYPVKNVVITYKNKRDLKQNSFEFLRTEIGYKLISVTIQNGKLK